MLSESWLCRVVSFAHSYLSRILHLEFDYHRNILQDMWRGDAYAYAEKSATILLSEESRTVLF